MHTWLTNFLTKRKMRVVLEGEVSEEVSVDSGFPQGTVLGLLLFLCHISDSPDSVKSTVRLFADDCLLYCEICSFQDHLTLQSNPRQLEDGPSSGGCTSVPKSAIFSEQKTNPNSFTV